MSALWKYNVHKHAWEHERSLNNSTAEEKVGYLTLFQRDEPTALFTIADKKPKVRPASDPLTFHEEEAKRRKSNKLMAEKIGRMVEENTLNWFSKK